MFMTTIPMNGKDKYAAIIMEVKWPIQNISRGMLTMGISLFVRIIAIPSVL